MQDRGSAFTTTPLPHLPSSSHQRSRTFRLSFLMFHISFRWINSIMFLMVWLRVKFLFWKFFFSSYFRMTTKDFWNWKIQKIMTPKGFSSKLFFQNSCFFSNISYRRCHRGPFIGLKECIWDLLLKIVNFTRSILSGKHLWGHDFLDFSLPKNSPHHIEITGGKKISISQC